ncbi:hypothetical protein FCM35_KLT20060 [Carex littledalei]|uniref:Uncharacterized protein n=1 Tax=Carex littledalei TaxID=544730 RepID=A0A833R9M5_9POAL|nr:hypothetical protein FCM35_KLT20060 [Carex littledalei]
MEDVCCAEEDIETLEHLFLNNPYATRFWQGLSVQLKIPKVAGNIPNDTWWNGRRHLSREQKKRWDMAWVAGSWAIWKERNRRTFSQKRKPVHILINDAAIDVHNWMLFG